MWLCSNCKSEIEDRYAHCWNCGGKRLPEPVSQGSSRQTSGQKPLESTPSRFATSRSTPRFDSYEELAPQPKSHIAIFRRGPFTRVFAFLIAAIFIGVLKFLDSPFFGKYGTYLIIGVGGIALLLILWRSFRRDKSEGVGIKLN